MNILAVDPSGSYHEGKGQTGWVLYKNDRVASFGLIKAVDYNSREKYWEAHTTMINTFIRTERIDVIVIENFRLYANKATSQIHSEMETIRLIGYLEMYLYEKGIVPEFQMASQVKTRCSDEILVRNKVITKDDGGRQFINGVNVSGHIVDALRHAYFYRISNRRK